jgi:hypothetical protein
MKKICKHCANEKELNAREFPLRTKKNGDNFFSCECRACYNIRKKKERLKQPTTKYMRMSPEGKKGSRLARARKYYKTPKGKGFLAFD